MPEQFSDFAGIPQSDLLTNALGKPQKPEVLPRPAVETKETVPMWDPDREDIVDIPRDYADHLVHVGWKFPDGSAPIMGEENVQQEKSDVGYAGMAQLAGHNYINNLLWGLPQAAHVGVNTLGHNLAPNSSMFSSPEELQKEDEHRKHLEELHPFVGTVSDLAGYISPGGVSSLIAKGAIKVGAHGLVEAGAKAAENKLFAKAVAAGYGSAKTEALIGKAVGAVAGTTRAVGHAVGTAAEMGARGAITQATEDETNGYDEGGKHYDHQIDAERVWDAAKDDFGWGLEVEGGIQGAFAGLRLARLGGSKTVDRLARIWPGKEKNIPGASVRGPLELKSKTVQYVRVKTKYGKVDTKVSTGGGFEERSTATKDNHLKDVVDNSETKASFVKKDETLGETRTRTPDLFTQEVKWKEPMPELADVEEQEIKPLKRETGIAWKKGATNAERLTGTKQALDDLTDSTEEGKTAMGQVTHYEETIDNLLKKKQAVGYLDLPELEALRQAKKSKVFWTNHLEHAFPETEGKLGYRNWKDEYYNIKNNLHEEVSPKELKKDPRFRSRTIKELTEKGREESSYDNYHKYDYEDGEDKTKTRSHTKDEKVDEERLKSHKNIEAKTVNTKSGEDTHEFAPFETLRYAPSRLKATKLEHVASIKDGVRAPLMYGAGALGYLTGGALGATMLAGQLMALDTLIPKALNNREAVSAVFDRLSKKSVKGAASALRSYKKHSARESHDYNPVDVKHYNKSQANVLSNSNPSVAKESVIKGMGDDVAAQHPILTQNLVRMNTDVASILSQHLIKDNRAPALRQGPFIPPRSQQIKFLKLYNAATKPLEVIKNPSPAQMEIIAQVMPMHHRILTSAISGMLVHDPSQINNAKQRQLSILMGSNYTPRQDPDYLKRQQMTAHIDETPKPPMGKGGSGPSLSGPKSAKVTTNAVNIDATPDQLNQLT